MSYPWSCHNKEIVMRGYIECYEKYLDFEKGIKIAFKFITLLFYKEYLYSGCEKLLLPLICLYISASAVSALFIEDADLLQRIMTIIISIGSTQVLTKVVSITLHEEDLNSILLWLRDIHRIRQIGSVNHSSQTNLETSLKFTKMIPKYLFQIAK